MIYYSHISTLRRVKVTEPRGQQPSQESSAMALPPTENGEFKKSRSTLEDPARRRASRGFPAARQRSAAGHRPCSPARDSGSTSSPRRDRRPEKTRRADSCTVQYT